MKKLIVILFAVILLTGCAIQRNQKREYFTLNELQSFYGLTNKECKSIEKDPNVESIYHCEKGRMYKFSR
jgi:PBP1b-binding outer membrane lipoprotein LpoB